MDEEDRNDCRFIVWELSHQVHAVSSMHSVQLVRDRHDFGQSWGDPVEIEAGPPHNFAYPDVLCWGPTGELKVAYSLWGSGLRIATLALNPGGE